MDSVLPKGSSVPIGSYKSCSGRTKHLVYGARKKLCLECGESVAVAKRKCDCGSEFGSKKKAVGERMPKYKTNITQQKDKLETVVHTLNRDHDMHSIVMSAKVNVDGSRCYDFGTSPGWSAELMKDKEIINSPSNLLVRSFKKVFEQKIANDKKEEIEDRMSINVVDAEDNGSKMKEPLSAEDNNCIEDDNSRIEDPISAKVGKDVTTCSNPLKIDGDEIQPKSLAEVKPLDVLACYTEEIGVFWLFLVEKANEETIKGRWFQKTEGRTYSLINRRVEIQVNSVVRFGVDVDMLYVLPRHSIMNEHYLISLAVEKCLEREIIPS